MKSYISLLLLTLLEGGVYTEPQLITFKEGKLGVNFGGYHAGVGLGGLLNGGGIGSLFAEAGTPYGQSAKAGLGGAADANGNAAGGLYAGATAGGNVRASAGLAGGVSGDSSAGVGYSSAQAGGRHAGAVLGGETNLKGSSRFPISGGSFAVPENINQDAVAEKKSHVEFNFDAANEVAAPITDVKSNVVTISKTHTNTNVEVEPENFKDINGDTTLRIKEKHRVHVHNKPNRRHFGKHIAGYVGAAVGISPSQSVASTSDSVVEIVKPAIQRRLDTDTQSHIDASSSIDSHSQASGQVSYNKQVTFQSNPTFFRDIFNIPIAALKAVNDLVSNTAKNTKVSVQKSASVQADTISSKHAPLSSVSSSSSDGRLSIETPEASKVIDDIFSIPINTLSAVNKFLENNVPIRKKVQVAVEGDGEPTKIILGPQARRRAGRAHTRVIVQENV